MHSRSQHTKLMIVYWMQNTNITGDPNVFRTGNANRGRAAGDRSPISRPDR